MNTVVWAETLIHDNKIRWILPENNTKEEIIAPPNDVRSSLRNDGGRYLIERPVKVLKYFIIFASCDIYPIREPGRTMMV
jgi:hypothetical protein